MPFLIILGVILLLIALLLFMPLSLYLKLDGDFYYKVKFAGITVYKEKPSKEDESWENLAKQESEKGEKDLKKDNYFTQLRKKYGFTKAVREILDFVSSILTKFKKSLKYIHVKKLYFNVVIGGDDAAQTAIEYGALCTAVYQLGSFVCTNAKVGVRNIEVTPNFDNTNSKLEFSAIVKMKVFFLLKAFLAIFNDYKNFKTRNDLK